jgi:type I restriction enzyme, S subunit
MMTWHPHSIEEITHVVTKGTTPTTLGRQFTDSGVNFIKAEALNGDSGLDSEGFFHIDEDTHELLARSMLQEDDVLVTIAGAQVGKCGYVKAEHLPANTNQAVGIVRINKHKAVPRFVYYFFKQASTFALCQSLGGQAAQPNVNLTVLKSIKVPLPSLDIQETITSILSAYDDLIENNRRRMVLLEEAARQLYREWFVRFRFPGHEHTRITNGLPEGWEECRIREFGEVVTGKTPSTKDSDNYGGEILFIKTPDMHGNVFVIETETRLTAKGANTEPGKFIPTNALLVSCIGTIGVVSLTSVRSQFNQQINAVVPFEDAYRYYCFFAFKDLKESMEAIGGGATMGNVNKKKFESLKVLKPSMPLLRDFHEFCNPLFQQIQVLCFQNQKLRAARDLLLPRLMSGEIVA